MRSFSQPASSGLRYACIAGEGAAIRALYDAQNLPHGCDLQTQNVVDENRPIHVGVGEAV